MAKLVPNIAVKEIGLKPERDVAAALLGQLPENVTVFHSYPWLRPERNDKTGKVTLQEGEIDFLIVWPELGILVIEVKGGTISYDANNRAWFRVLGQTNKSIKDPFEQARRNTHQIVNALKRKVFSGNGRPFTYGYAVIFPDCTYNGPLPPGATPAITLSSTDLNNVSIKLEGALRQWCKRSEPYRFSRNELTMIQRTLLPEFNIVPVLSRTIAEQEEKLVRLTEEQIRLLASMSENKRAVIKGVAGSGKTMLAKRQAEIFAENGKSTLLVCFNKELAAWLRLGIREEHQNFVSVHHFHELCANFCKKAGIMFSPPEQNSDVFWKQEAPNLLLDAIELVTGRYEAVVIDEGQDFYPDWWIPLELLNINGGDGCLYIFYDPAQNLFNDGEVSVPAVGAHFELPTNCRNTKRISETCSTILKKTIRMHPYAPEGISTELIRVKEYRIPSTVDSIIRNLISSEDISNSQVVILSPSKFARSRLNGQNEVGGLPLVHNSFEWRDGGGILYSTIRSFKGLEADVVVLIDVVKPGSVGNFTVSDFYVACSRAKHVLTIVHSDDIDVLDV